MRPDDQFVFQVFVVCVDGYCRHTAPFPNEAAAQRWAESGHICHRRHWLSYTRIDNDTVSRGTALLALAGFDRSAAEALTVEEIEALLGVEIAGRNEGAHWEAVLDRLDWLKPSQLLGPRSSLEVE